MNQKMWDRIGAVAGLVFVVVMLGPSIFLIPGGSGGIDGPAVLKARWVHENRLAIQATMIIAIFSIGAFVWFVCQLNHVFGRAEGETKLVTPYVFGTGLVLAAVYPLACFPKILMTLLDQQGRLTDEGVINLLGISDRPEALTADDRDWIGFSA